MLLISATTSNAKDEFHKKKIENLLVKILDCIPRYLLESVLIVICVLSETIRQSPPQLGLLQY